MIWFWPVSFLPSMYVRYYYDEDGILHRRVDPPPPQGGITK